MLDLSVFPLTTPLTDDNKPIIGQFATRVISLQYFAGIRALYPDVNWTGVASTVSHYAAVIESGFISTPETREKVKKAKEFLSIILNLEILKADNFLDVPCSEMLGDTGCKPTCGCTDEDNPNCCCPDVHFRDDHTLRIVWLSNMILTADDAQGVEVPVTKQMRRGLCWYDIPENAAKLKIRLRWWDIFNTHEIDLQDIE